MAAEQDAEIGFFQSVEPMNDGNRNHARLDPILFFLRSRLYVLFDGNEHGTWRDHPRNVVTSVDTFHDLWFRQDARPTYLARLVILPDTGPIPYLWE